MPILVILLLFCLPAVAEDCKYNYFSNHKVSTSVCYTENRFGKACAYNRQGKMIYEKAIRKIAGHAYVVFSYYDDGAVSKAEWRDAPDGGIQWYHTTTVFAHDGTVVSETEDGWDNKPTVAPPDVRKRQPAETMQCAPIWKSEFWMINAANHPVYVHADRMGAVNETYTLRLQPGDTACGGFVIQAAFFDRPDKYFIFMAADATTNTSRPQVKLSYELQFAPGVRRYYYKVK